MEYWPEINAGLFLTAKELIFYNNTVPDRNSLLKNRVVKLIFKS